MADAKERGESGRRKKDSRRKKRDDEVATPSESGPLTGDHVGGFDLGPRIGRGGMGDVYEATQCSLDRQVAIKIVSSELSLGNPVLIERLAREAVATAAVAHPNLVAVYDAGVDDDVHFIAMEILRGGTLAEELDRKGPFSEERALDAVRQVASALDALHDAGLIHRDIKPENVMRDGVRGLVKLLDLGVARATDTDADGSVTRAGFSVGTPTYMSPEQAEGRQDIGPRSDVYGLGVMLFELLAGEAPFEGETRDVMLAHLRDEPPSLADLGVRAATATEELVADMLEKSPRRRPSAGEVADRIERTLRRLRDRDDDDDEESGRRRRDSRRRSGAGSSRRMKAARDAATPRRPASARPTRQSGGSVAAVRSPRASRPRGGRSLAPAGIALVAIAIGLGVLAELGSGDGTTARDRVDRRARGGPRAPTSTTPAGGAPTVPATGGGPRTVADVVATDRTGAGAGGATTTTRPPVAGTGTNATGGTSGLERPSTSIDVAGPAGAIAKRRDELIVEARTLASRGALGDAFAILDSLREQLPKGLLGPVLLALKELETGLDDRVAALCRDCLAHASAGDFDAAHEALARARAVGRPRHRDELAVTERTMQKIALRALREGEPDDAPPPGEEQPFDDEPVAAVDEPPGADEPPGPAAGDLALLPDRVKDWLELRRKALCDGCDGTSIIPCPKCGGDGWNEVYYNNVRKINWNHTKKCMRCNADGKGPSVPDRRADPIDGENAGKARCGRRGCSFGVNMRWFEKLVWEFRSPEGRAKLLEQVPSITAFAEALAAHLNSRTLAGEEKPIEVVARRHGMEHEILTALILPHADVWLIKDVSRWSAVEVADDGTVGIELERTQGGRTVETWREEPRWVWSGREWYLE